MTAREVAKDINFAIDVTEPSEVLLARFEAIIAAAIATVERETWERAAEQVANSVTKDDADKSHQLFLARMLRQLAEGRTA